MIFPDFNSGPEEVPKNKSFDLGPADSPVWKVLTYLLLTAVTILGLFLLFTVGFIVYGVVFAVTHPMEPRTALFGVGLCVGVFCAVLWVMDLTTIFTLGESDRRFLRNGLVAGILTAFGAGVSMALKGETPKPQPQNQASQDQSSTKKESVKTRQAEEKSKVKQAK